MKDIKNCSFIFDLDGTLIDTEKLYRKYWPMALSDYGYFLSDERALMLRSLGRPFAPRQFKDWYGEDFDYDLVRKRRKEYVEGFIEKNGVELRPGVKELLTFLKENKITVAIATATDLQRTKKYLAMTGIDKFFDEEKIICATMVEHGKPAPDIYEYVLKTLNASPSDCFAVEDAPNGVKSAKAAGLNVIFVPDQSPADDSIKDLLYADFPVISDIKTLF